MNLILKWNHGNETLSNVAKKSGLTRERIRQIIRNKIIDLFVNVIKKRWGKIDYLFCGHGGASYYPNSIHCPDKDDLEVAKTREQFFLHNFCLQLQLQVLSFLLHFGSSNFPQ